VDPDAVPALVRAASTKASATGAAKPAGDMTADVVDFTRAGASGSGDLLSHSILGTRPLAAAAGAADESAVHADAVAELSCLVAEELGLDDEERREVETAGMLHDVGKAEIPAELVLKAGPLANEEREVMEQHTVLGEVLLERTDPSLREVARLVRSCHERWDGGGYPDGLADEDIPLAARIVFCCDSYDAMTTDRPYRRALGHHRATAELRRCSGTQFDPTVVDALLRVLADTAPRGYARRPR
jgi:HD-GYP domain-containing protein (c-di-GMP phosphodiesterase class II)